MYRGFFIMLFCFVFLTSCRATRQETQKSTSTSENFSEKRESYRDTVLFAPASSTSLKISVNEFFKDSLKVISKPKVFTQKNGNATAKVRIERDTIFVTATCDSLALRAKIKSELQKEFSASTKDQATELSKETGYNFIDIISFLIAGIVIGFVGTITIKGIL